MTMDLLNNWLSQLEKINTINDLNNFKSSILGKSGIINNEMKKISTMSDGEKKEFGKNINQLKQTIEQAISNKKAQINATYIENILKQDKIDVTLPCVNSSIGNRHIISTYISRIRDHYTKRGFTVIEGNEIDTDFFNFDALNIPAHHPARQESDTFYIDGYSDTLLRTQTSTAQIHAMLDIGVPIRMISMGKVYRSDNLDMTHSPMFHQIECLVVDSNPISIRNMKSEIQKMLAFIFDTDIQNIAMRLRPSYFPFTEPGVEVDCKYKKLDDKIVLSCEGDKWMEIAGAGMVHPNVFSACKLPTNLFGFAFGMGLERLIMLKHGINDIRILCEH